ncbi:hypothetical protein BPAE_0035g00630 [Botrytis paeoniae]|uniref:Zn(2)-C6 fungal-type domain-containing protein n=1 Tax=Botrytis paeoniae TaxID=278948 RepID=A0A4Z1FYG0_9HELO|nr:hypothetical protein BPAE_0035g00630 [Botrytis paeoniae]
MPRRKSPDTGKCKASRTRSLSGCNTCRRRKVKCGEERPKCQRCASTGYDCKYNLVLKWQEEFARRDAAFGRSGVWKKIDHRGSTSDVHQSCSYDPSSEMVTQCYIPHISHHHFVNGTVENFHRMLSCGQDDQAGVERELMDTAVEVTTLTCPRLNYIPAFTAVPSRYLVPSSIISSFPHVDDINTTLLFQYYVDRLCPLTTPNQSTNSPFATIVLPFALSTSQSTLQSLLALSACHKSKTDASWGPVAMQLKARTLYFLRGRLNQGDSVEISRDPEIITISMIMCLYEIINTCDEQWVVYLRGARDIIRIRKQFPLLATEKSQWQPLLSFSERFFAYQDVLGRTACAGVPNFKSCAWTSKAHEIDISMGCSPELFHILGSITDLIKLKRKDAMCASEELFINKAAGLEQRLNGLVQTVHQDDDCVILHSAELKRQAAILYLHCTLHNASPSTVSVVRRVPEILQSISLCLDSGLVTSLTWPVFVAAVELNPLDDIIMVNNRSVSGRAFILSTLAVMSTCTISNLERTRSVIVDVWQRRDLSLLANTMHGITSDWEKYVEPSSPFIERLVLKSLPDQLNPDGQDTQ